MSNEQNRIFIAVALSAFVLFMWQSFFPSKTVPVNKEVATQTRSYEEKAKQVKTNETVRVESASEETSELKSFELSENEGKLELNSYLEIKDFQLEGPLKTFTEIVGSPNVFELFIKSDKGFKKVFFDKIENNEREIRGESTHSGISFSLKKLNDYRYSIDLFSDVPNKYRIRLNSREKDLGNGRLRQFLLFNTKVNRESIGDDAQFDSTLRWIGIDFNYHLFAVVFKNAKSAFAKTVRTGVEDVTNDGETESLKKGQLTVDLNESSRELNFSFVFSNKEYDVLKSQGDNLHQAVDFGMFEVISVPILRALQFFYKYVRNYGLSIIILTILIRLLTFPLQYKSFKSMKKMQVIQPELTKIRDKFKDDPQRMQKESMELFKRSGVNPLSGCLPMVLQMPVFFAFYSVLRESIELVDAPFIGWINDLSAKDPLYILPVLLTIAMFMHQKLTPTPSADPNQKKIMMLMPLIFGVFMLNLPAGLSLYILVSTIFGMLQQLFVYRQAS